MPDLFTLEEIRVVLYKSGTDPVELTPIHQSIAYSTNAVGGFGSCSFNLPGLWTKPKVNYGDVVRLMYDQFVLFEGRVEDVGIQVGAGDLATTVQAFGLARLLDDNAVRRIWLKRDLAGWVVPPAAAGNGHLGTPMTIKPASGAVTVGSYDPADLTRSGISIHGFVGGIAWPDQGWLGVELRLPAFSPSLSLRVAFEFAMSALTPGASNFRPIVQTTVDGTTWVRSAFPDTSATPTTYNSFACTAATNPLAIRVGIECVAGQASREADQINFDKIRVIASGMQGFSESSNNFAGFAGGLLLIDLIALVPGLTVGIVEDGTDFTVEALERIVRDSARSAVNEVAGYYSREWAVWDTPTPGVGRFDWKTPTLDEPQWIIPLESCDSLNLRGSVEGVEATSYVLYTDAASGRDAEASAASTEQRNPFVKQGRARDGLTNAGFPMTPNTAAALAAQLSAARGLWPPVTGTVTLPIIRPITHAYGPAKPAFAIRAGDNIQIVGLPKTDPLRGGRDGETFFHVSSCDVDATGGTVTLTLEGQTRAIDALLAKLAAVTRVLTG